MGYVNHFNELRRRDFDPDDARRGKAWVWTILNCNGVNNIGLCPACGERIQVIGNKVTDDGRLIGSCGDAFTIEAWEAE